MIYSVILKEKAMEAQKKKKIYSSDFDETSYKLGYLMAFHDVISIMKQQAKVFEINKKYIDPINDLDPEKELL